MNMEMQRNATVLFVALGLLIAGGCETDGAPVLSGEVSTWDSGLDGVTLTVTGAAVEGERSLTTDASGGYELSVAEQGQVHIAPARKGYVFEPPFLDIAVAGRDHADLDFAAYQIPEISVPEGLPFWNNPHIVIDEAVIADIGAYFFGQQGPDGDVLEFIAGYLPLATADRLCDEALNKRQLNRYMGNMYVSGYFGGTWLRDVLFSRDSGAQAGNPAEAIGDALLPGIMDRGGDRAIFSAVAAAVGAPVDLALTGGAEEIFIAARGMVEMLLMIYGYDWGYYYYLIDNPPEGAPELDDPLSCKRFMDCTMVNQELVTLTRYKPVLEDLYGAACSSGETPRWCAMKTAMNQIGKGAVAQGDSVWDGIMSANDMLDPAYAPLIDLSARFMLVSELTLLPTMQGWVGRDLTSARCGLLQASAMVAWLGSYVSGLSSTLPEGVFPEVTLP